MDRHRVAQWIVRKPRNFTAKFDTALAFYRQGKLQEAEQEFRTALEMVPSDAHTNVCLAHIVLVLGRTDEAIDFLDTAIKTCPMYAEAHALMGTAREIKGELISAELAWQKAIAFDSQLGIAHYNLARMYAVCSEYKRAMTHLEKAIRVERTFRKEAKCCPDFESMYRNREFRELVFGTAA